MFHTHFTTQYLTDWWVPLDDAIFSVFQPMLLSYESPIISFQCLHFLIFISCFFRTWSMNFGFFTHVSPHVQIVSCGNEDTLRFPCPVWESSFNRRTTVPFYLSSYYLVKIRFWMPTDISDLKRMHNSWSHSTPDTLLFPHPHLPSSVNIAFPFHCTKYILWEWFYVLHSPVLLEEVIETSSQGQTSNSVPN